MSRPNIFTMKDKFCFTEFVMKCKYDPFRILLQRINSVLLDLNEMEREKSPIFPFPFHSNRVKQNLSVFRRMRASSYSSGAEQLSNQAKWGIMRTL